jgi:sodium-dependent dicarboxylate transporter 2/3/5
MPWGVLILLGGGFALSDGSDKSGLSAWIGEQLKELETLPNEVILIIVMLLTTMVTEGKQLSPSAGKKILLSAE